MGCTTSTNHSETLATELETFRRALTRRWQKVVCQAILDDPEPEGSHNFPTVLHATVPTYLMAQRANLWDYRHPASQVHLRRGDCVYVAWVQGGADADISCVSCPGATGVPGQDVQLVDSRTGELVAVPPNIECGMGSILQAVENWAWAERTHVFEKLPLFYRHDVGALRRAHDTFIAIGNKLNLTPSEGSGDEVRATFTSVGERDLPVVVDTISAKDADGQDWWTGWTGLVAYQAKAGFFASVEPSLSNQAGIAGCLANLYAARAAIVKKGRCDGQAWVAWGTELLDETETTTTDLTDAWTAVSGVGHGIAVYSAWTGAGALTGAAVSLVGFLGTNFLPETKSMGYANTLEEAVDQLHEKIDELNSELVDLEYDYFWGAASLRVTMHGIHSYNLELYDLTQNNPAGDQDERSNEDDILRAPEVGDFLRLAEHTYQAGELYGDLVSEITETRSGDAHLAGEDGAPTEADTIVLELRDQLDGHLRTSCSRYLVAGDQVREAAADYVDVDTGQQAAFERYERIMDDWQRYGIGEYDVGFSPETYVEETDRSPVHDRYERTPPPGPGDYVTE